MSTFFPAGGPAHNTGPWWKVLHSAIQSGADLNALRLVHAVGITSIDETICANMEQHLHADAACMCYDDTSLLIIEPGITDEEVVHAAEDVLEVTREQLHLWRVVEALSDGLNFEPISPQDYTTETQSTPAVSEHHGIVLTDAEFSYFPLWDVQASEIFSYVCENVWNIGDDDRVPEEALEAFFAKTRHVFALDREALHKAVDQAQEFLNDYIFTNILIPVHYSTLSAPDLATPYLETCNESVWPVMDNVYFEITKVPVDYDAQALSSMIDSLAPYGKGVMIRVEKGFANFAALPAEKIFSVGLDFHYDARDDESIKADLGAFVEAIAPYNLRHHAHSLGNMDICVSAIRSGYDFISSNAIAPPLDTSSPQEDIAKPAEILRSIMKGIV